MAFEDNESFKKRQIYMVHRKNLQESMPRYMEKQIHTSVTHVFQKEMEQRIVIYEYTVDKWSQNLQL